MGVVQRRRLSRRLQIDQAVRPVSVELEHPIANDLKRHTAKLRRLGEDWYNSQAVGWAEVGFAARVWTMFGRCFPTVDKLRLVWVGAAGEAAPTTAS